MKLMDVLLCILSTFIVAMSYVIVKFGLAHFGPITITFFRYIMVSIILCPFFIKTMMRKNFPWRIMIVMSLIFSVGFQMLVVSALYSGLDITTSVILNQLSMPFTAILGAYLLDEKITKRVILGLIISFAGMVVVVGSPTLDDNSMGILLAISGALFYAVNNILVKKFRQKDDSKYSNPVLILCATSLISIPILFTLSILMENLTLEHVYAADYSVWLSVFFLAIPTSIISFGIWISLMQKYPVYMVSPFSLLVPIFATTMSIIFLEEEISLNIIIGGVITIIGLAFINLKLTKKNVL